MGKVGGKGEVSTQLLTKIANFLAAGLYDSSYDMGIRVVLVDEDGDYLTSSGGGGAGGGASTYSTAQGDFTVAVSPGTSAFTVSANRFPTTITADHIVSGGFCKITLASTGKTEDCDLSSVSVTGTTGGAIVTLADQEVFATGDTIHLKMEGPLKHDDASQDLQKVSVYNAPYAHRTDPENWSMTDVTGLQRQIIYMDTFKSFNFQYVYSQTGSQTGTMKTYRSNVAGADTSSLTNWVDCSTDVLGTASIEMAGTGTTEDFVESTGPTSPLKYMLEIDITAAGTGVDVASDVYIRKFY
jgi:hypothetical protein